MKRLNPLLPDRIHPTERRAVLCSLLALGLIHLRQRIRTQPSDEMGESLYTIRRTGAFMQIQPTGATHDKTRP